MCGVSEPFPDPTTPASSRTEVFLRYLDFFRSRVAARIQALPEASLRSSTLPSGWTPLELVKHLRYVELRWLEWGFEGRDVGDPWGDRAGGRWFTGPDETAATLLADLNAQGARSRAIIEAHPLDEVGQPGPGDPRAGPVPPDPGIRPARRPPGHRHRARRRRAGRIRQVIGPAGARRSAPACSRRAGWLTRLVGHALVDALAQALDPGAQDVAWLQVDRRLPGVAHPAGGAGGDQVAGPQRDRLARVGDDLRRAEQQVRGS